MWSASDRVTSWLPLFDFSSQLWWIHLRKCVSSNGRRPSSSDDVSLRLMDCAHVPMAIFCHRCAAPEWNDTDYFVASDASANATMQLVSAPSSVQLCRSLTCPHTAICISRCHAGVFCSHLLIAPVLLTIFDYPTELQLQKTK